MHARMVDVVISGSVQFVQFDLRFKKNNHYHLLLQLLARNNLKMIWSVEKHKRETDWEKESGENGECGWTWFYSGCAVPTLQVRKATVCTVPFIVIRHSFHSITLQNALRVTEWNQNACLWSKNYFCHFSYARIKPFFSSWYIFGKGNTMSHALVSYHFSQ